MSRPRTAPTVAGASFANDASIWGGGLEVGGQGSTTLDGVTVSNNDSAQEGGGIFVFGDLTLVNTTVTGNTATDIGGGIHNDSGAKLSMTGGEVTFNSARSGGGISSEGPCIECGHRRPGQLPWTASQSATTRRTTREGASSSSTAPT